MTVELNDPIVQEIQKLNCLAGYQSIPDLPRMVNGIPFWQVGEAYREYYMAGTKDSKRYLMTCLVDGGDETISESMEEVSDFVDIRTRLECMRDAE